MRVKYTLPAAADLDHVLDYLKQHSPQGARNVQQRIKAIERLLSHFPLSGSPTRLPWLRRIVATPYPYLIFYEVTGEDVIIHAVRHGMRDPETMPGG